MSGTATELLMADDSDRMDYPFQLRVSKRWLAIVEKAADQLGMSTAAYIRMATNRQLTNDGIEVPPPPKRVRKPKS